MEHLVHLRDKDNVLSLPTCSTVTGVSIRVWLPRGLKVAANKTSPDLQPCQGGLVLLCEQIPLTQGSTCRGVHWSKSCFRSAILRTSMKVLPSRSSWRKSFKNLWFQYPPSPSQRHTLPEGDFVEWFHPPSDLQ